MVDAPLVVSIQECNQRSASCGDAGISCGARPIRNSVLKYCGTHRGRNRSGAICGAIINDNHLPCLAFLPSNGRQRGSDEALGVERWHHHAVLTLGVQLYLQNAGSIAGE